MTALLFEVETPVGVLVRCTSLYWDFIVTEKHPVLHGQEQAIQNVLAEPNEVRRSQKDANVLLFYQAVAARWLCAVVRRDNGTGFLITGYPTDKVKVGEIIWPKSK